MPDAIVGSPQFVLAVAGGAGATVLLASFLAFPISTTHGLTGALVGAGLASAPNALNFSMLGSTFIVPLLLSPLLAVATGATVYLGFRFARLRFGLTKEMCVCAGLETVIVPIPQPDGVFAAQSTPTLSVTMDQPATCAERYSGTVF